MKQLLDKIEEYGFTCEGGPLENCLTWRELKAELLRPDWQKRVIEERDALQEKVDKLVAFTSTNLFYQQGYVTRVQMNEQLTHMRSYLDVLDQRIEAFRG